MNSRLTSAWNWIKPYSKIGWLPVVLSVLLIIESRLFNIWLNILPGLYKFRQAAALVGLSALIFGPAVFFNKKIWRYLYLAALSVLVALVFISQFLYYRYSGGFLEFSAITYAGQTAELWGTIRTFISPEMLLFLLPLLVIIVGYFFAPDRNAELGKLKKFFAAIGLILIFCAGYGTLLELEIHDWGNATQLYSAVYDVATLETKMGTPNYYLENAIRYALLPHQVSPQDKAFLTSWAASRPTPTPAADFGELKGRNLFFLQIESLENWVIGYQVNGVEVAPNLTQLASEGEYFPNYYSQIGPGNTADAEFSTLNSLYPLPDSVAFISHPQNQSAALPSLLDGHGYVTAVMHGDVASFWNRANAYPPLGYEQQFSAQDYTVTRAVGFDNLGDAEFFPQSIPKLQKLPQPFMATLITLSTHTPFALPKDLQTLVFPKDTTLTSTQQQYLQAVHYSDQALGDFIASLKTAGLYNNSLITIYGDHEAFIGTPDSQTNHVPLILLAGNSKLQGVNPTPGSHIDLYPTVADLLGIEYPKSVLGQDLLTTTTPVVTQRVLGTGAIKFIISGTMKYTGSVDGDFAHGTCSSWPGGQSLPVADCQTLYNQQSDTVRASDIVVRYNLLPLLNP